MIPLLFRDVAKHPVRAVLGKLDERTTRSLKKISLLTQSEYTDKFAIVIFKR